MNYKKIMTVMMAVMISAIISSCASTGKTPNDLSASDILSTTQGQIRVGSLNNDPMSDAQVTLGRALATWGTNDVAKGAKAYERLLETYKSDDGNFEVAVLSALALHYLENGNRKDFNNTVTRLRHYVDSSRYFSEETQYVLQVDDALKGSLIKESYGRGNSPQLSRAIRDVVNGANVAK